MRTPAPSYTSTEGTTGDQYIWIGPAWGEWDIAANWLDTSTGADPATIAPGAMDGATFDSSTSQYQAIGGTGASATLTFNGYNAVTGQLTTQGLTVQGGSDGSLDIGPGGALTAATAMLSADVIVDGTFSVTGLATETASLSVSSTGVVRLGALALSNTADAGFSVISLDPAASIELGTAGHAVAGALTLDQGASLGSTTSFVEVLGNVVDNGILSIGNQASASGLASSLSIQGVLSGTGQVRNADAATLDVSNLLTSSGPVASICAGDLTISLDRNANLISSAIGAGNTIALAGGNQLTLEAQTGGGPPGIGGSFQDAGVIAGFDESDAILLQGTQITSVVYAAGTLAGTGSIAIFDGTSQIGALPLAGDYTGRTFLAIAVDAVKTELVLQAPSNGGASAGTGGGEQYVWIGPISGDWNAAANWRDTTTGASPAAIAPGALDSVTFDSPIDSSPALGNAFQVISGTGDAASLSFAGNNLVTGQLATTTLAVQGSSPSSLDLGTGATLSAVAADLDGLVTVGAGAARLVVSQSLTEEGTLQIWNGGAAQFGEAALAGGYTVIDVDTTSSVEVGAAGGATTGALTIDHGASLTSTALYASIGNNVVDNGTLGIGVPDGSAAAGSILQIRGILSGAGLVQLGDGIEVDVLTPGTAFATSPTSIAAGSLTISLGNGASFSTGAAIGAGNTIAFAGSSAQLTLAAIPTDPSDTTSSFQDAATITGFDQTDSILLQGAAVTTALYAAGTQVATGSLTLLNGTTQLGTLAIAGDYTGDSFLVTPSGGAGAQITLFLGAVVVGDNSISVTPLAGHTVSLDQLAGDANIIANGTIPTLIVNGPGTVTTGGSLTIGDLEVRGGAVVVLNGAILTTDPVSVDADGDISGYGTIAGAVADTGTITASGGTLVLSDAISGPGHLTAASGATLSLDGGGSASGGQLDSATDGTLYFGAAAGGTPGFSVVSGFYAVANTVVDGSTLDLSAAAGAGFGDSLRLTAGRLQLGAITGSVYGVLTQGGGAIAGTGTLSLSGPVWLTGGVETGGGTTRMTAVAVIDGSLQLDGGRILENDGLLDWNAGDIQLGAGDPAAANHSASLVNAGVFDITASGRIAVTGGSGSVSNTGVLVADTGSGEADIDAPLSSAGIIQLRTGTLSLSGGGSAADIAVAGGATLQFGVPADGTVGATFTLRDTVRNDGTIAVAADRLVLDAGQSGAGVFLLDGAGTMEFVHGTASGSGLEFLAQGATLAVDSVGSFGAAITGFGGTDVIDLTAVAFPAAVASFNGGTLSVSDGAHRAAVSLTGSYGEDGFHLTDDGHGGTAVSYG